MPVSALTVLLRILGGGSVSEEEQKELYRETLLLVLARGAYSDTNIASAEVDTAQKIYQAHTNETLETADFRHAARSELFEATPLNRYVSRAAALLNIEHRRDIAAALREMIHADESVSPNEIEFFNTTAKALDLTYADGVGLIARS